MSQETRAVDLGKRKVARSRVVQVDADSLYSLVSNPHRHHELDGSGTVGAAIEGPTSPHVGNTFTTAMTLGPIRYKTRSTVTEAVAGKTFEWRLPLGHSWRWEFEPQDDGSTRVTEIFNYSKARAAWFIELIGYPRRNAAGIEATLAGLESRFESSSA